MAGIELFLDDDYIVDLMQVSVSLLLFFQNNNTYRENIYIFNRILAKTRSQINQINADISHLLIFVKPPPPLYKSKN